MEGNVVRWSFLNLFFFCFGEWWDDWVIPCCDFCFIVIVGDGFRGMGSRFKFNLL